MSLKDCMIKNGFTEDDIYDLTGGQEMNENQFVQAMVKAQAELDERSRRAKIQMLAIDGAVQKINSHPDGPARGLLSMLAFDKTGKSGTLSIDILSDQYARFAYREMSEMMEALMPNIRNGYKVDPTIRTNIVKEIFGEASGDAQASVFAKAFNKANEDLRIMHNKMGGNIRKLDQWNLPQNHNPIKFRKSSQKEWVDNLLDNDMLDLANMENRHTGESFKSKEELRPFLEAMYDNVVTNGATKMDWEAAQFKDIRVARGITSRQRFLKFKNADSYLKYQKQFGEPDVYSAMITHIQGLARETAMIKTLGPNPGAAYNYLRAKAAASPNVNNRLLGRADNVMKDLTGELAGTNNRLQEWAEKVRAVMTFKLGAASISALGDQGTLALTAKINDIPMFDTQMKFLKTLADGEEKQFLLQSGVNADYVIDVTSGLNRYADVDTNQFMGKVADRYLRVSGLNAMTEAGRASIQLGALGHLANVDKLKWDELSPGNLRMLTESGINETDWKVMTRSKKHVIKGAKYLDMRELPIELQTKVGNMMDVLAYRAIPAPDAEVRAVLRQGTEAGTLPGEVFRSGGQFKSFGVSVLLYHANFAMAQSMGTATGYFAGLFLATTMMGALAIQAKQLAAGKEPMDSRDPKFMLAAITQGGGFGIYADFLFRDYTRYGTSFFATLAGPSLGAVETLTRDVLLANTQKAIKDAVEGNPDAFKELAQGLGTSAVDELRKNLPTQLWYTKLAADRYLFQLGNQLIDSNYINKLHRQEARLQREEGRGFLFDPIEL